ncbi:hypothetical protein [Streptomyces capoamus]|uniref:hypothetical protein n=1 Tax=Streptomyces capoamus TaxID=68183 RepID=UPI0016723D0F|nr:hypothetical protein [Streptomyces capoamus]
MRLASDSDSDSDSSGSGSGGGSDSGTRTTSGLPAGTTGWMAKRYTRAHTCLQID